MKSIRQRNPLAFDGLMLVGFVGIAFAGYSLASEADQTGALTAVIGLALICVLLIVSR